MAGFRRSTAPQYWFLTRTARTITYAPFAVTLSFNYINVLFPTDFCRYDSQMLYDMADFHTGLQILTEKADNGIVKVTDEISLSSRLCNIFTVHILTATWLIKIIVCKTSFIFCRLVSKVALLTRRNSNTLLCMCLTSAVHALVTSLHNSRTPCISDWAY